MKTFLMCAVLVSLCSCGNSSKTSDLGQSEQSQLQEKSPDAFILPELNQHRVMTTDASISRLFENTTINPKKQGDVLGDNAFYVLIHENVYPSYQKIELRFYSKTKVNSISYIDLAGKDSTFLNVDKSNVRKLGLKEVPYFERNELAWGKVNFDYPEGNMLDKAYLIETEEVGVKGKKEFKSESLYLIWFECSGAIKDVSGIAYSCGKNRLRFHFKLLDYSLAAINN